MSPAPSRQASFRLLVVQSSDRRPECVSQFTNAGFAAHLSFVFEPTFVTQKLRERSYDAVLWTLSSKQDLAILQEFLQGTDSIPPVIVIGSRECHNPATETVLLGLVDNGIADFLFDDESPTILVRSVLKIGLKQANNHGHQPRSTSDFIATVDAFPALLEACPFAVVALTPEGTVSLWNRSAEKIYGWRSEEVIGKPLPTIPANDEPEFRQLLESQLRGVAYAAKEVRRRRKDGTLIDVSLWTAPLRDQHGQIRGKLAITADVTDLHRAAREHSELLESQRETHERPGDGAVPRLIRSGAGWHR